MLHTVAPFREDQAARADEVLLRARATIATAQANVDRFHATFRLYRDAMARSRRLRDALRAEPVGTVARAVGEFARTDPPGTPGRRPLPAAPLTDREVEVAGLVADGLTNKLIARRLCLEEGTVANHVRRIRLKLSLSCRAELAAWVARQDAAARLARS